MLVRHYNMLLQHRRYHHLLLQGVCIADLKTDTAEILLFQLLDYYVEVHFDCVQDLILSSKCFTDTDELEPFLNAIDLSDIQAYLKGWHQG